MAFFRFRKANGAAAPEKSAPAPQAHSVGAAGLDELRRQAKHRLIGSAILVLVAVIGFPWVVDRQPRPVAVDMPIEIPDKQAIKPLVHAPAAAVKLPLEEVVEPAKTSAPTAQTKVDAPKPEPVKAPEPVKEAKESHQDVKKVDAVKPESAKTESPKPDSAKTDVTKVEKPEKTDKPAETKASTTDRHDAARAQALLEGKEPTSASAAGDADRWVLQIGAYADAAKARDARMKLEKAGFKTYTQVVDTKDGKRTRVRVGPLNSKAEADKMADKVKSLDLPVSVLSL